MFGLSRVDIFSDFHFTWGRNSILTRLNANGEGNLNTILSDLSRDLRATDISSHASIQECQALANKIREEVQKLGVSLAGLSPKIDMQRQTVGTGSLSLHEDNIPLRNKGSGTKRLIGTAMQMNLHGGKNISLIDELEIGLEPHRIRGLIHKLKNSKQQIFTTTHSPVVIRELDVTDDNLYVCKRDKTGVVILQSLATVPDIQGQVRANAEAFLGSRIICCEGSTEVGCLRAYDVYRLGEGDPPVWSLATSYLDCGGAAGIIPVSRNLLTLGYRTAVLCDNDAPQHLPHTAIQALHDAGVHICQWEDGNSTEHQLFLDLQWAYIPALLHTICDSHDTLELASVIDRIIKEPLIAAKKLKTDSATWPESSELRQVIGDLANKGKWIKRIDYAENAFKFALPHLKNESIIETCLDTLWSWIQRNE